MISEQKVHSLNQVIKIMLKDYYSLNSKNVAPLQ